jgi:hypothetical protein
MVIPLLFVILSCGSIPSSRGTTGGRSAPAWVHAVDSVYDRAQYAAATGFGSSRAMAEANALAALTAFFGQTVQVDRTAASSYQQAIVNGVLESWVDTAELRVNVRTTAAMDNLMGVEIAEVWFDSRDTYYAVAVMEKVRAVRIYRDLLQANLNVINNLVTMTPNERNSLAGIIRYQFAAVVADINYSYRSIVLLLGGTAPDITSGDFYRLEAQNLIRAIPIGINVTNDRNGRIFGAFARSFTDYGFEIVSGQPRLGNTRYVLDVSINLSPVDLPNNPNYFSRIEMEANLRDTHLGLVLLPHPFASREGHTSQSEAENRAIMAAERNINNEFTIRLQEYLTSLYPRI